VWRFRAAREKLKVAEQSRPVALASTSDRNSSLALETVLALIDQRRASSGSSRSNSVTGEARPRANSRAGVVFPAVLPGSPPPDAYVRGPPAAAATRPESAASLSVAHPAHRAAVVPSSAGGGGGVRATPPFTTLSPFMASPRPVPLWKLPLR